MARARGCGWGRLKAGPARRRCDDAAGQRAATPSPGKADRGKGSTPRRPRRPQARPAPTWDVLIVAMVAPSSNQREEKSQPLSAAVASSCHTRRATRASRKPPPGTIPGSSPPPPSSAAASPAAAAAAAAAADGVGAAGPPGASCAAAAACAAFLAVAVSFACDSGRGSNQSAQYLRFSNNQQIWGGLLCLSAEKRFPGAAVGCNLYERCSSPDQPVP
jgi:hypothetical protein